MSDSDDPMENVGPEGCAPSPEDVKHNQRKGDPPGDCEWQPSDERAEAFPIEMLATPIGRDQLPDHSVDSDHQAAEAPPFTVEGMCCIEDKRQYVEIFQEHLYRRGLALPAPDDWPEPDRHGIRLFNVYILGGEHRAMVRARSRFADDGTDRERMTFAPSDVVTRWGLALVKVVDSLAWIVVQPARERCVYYKRQHFPTSQPDPLQPGHNEVFRHCTHPARRSVGGASMDLSDGNIYGCDHREPHDAESVKWLDNFDDAKIRDQPHRVRLPMFGIGGDVVIVPEETKPS